MSIFDEFGVWFCYIFVFLFRMTTETFEAARLLFVLFVIVLRLGLFRRYLQAFLNIAPQKLHYLNRESGKITNLDMQKLVSVFFFF